MHNVWIQKHLRWCNDQVEIQRFFLPFPLIAECNMVVYLDMWRPVLNDLEQNQGETPVYEAWTDMQRDMIRHNSITSAEVLQNKIASSCLLFPNLGDFKWASPLKYMEVAEVLAREVVLDLAEIMREVNG